MEKTHNQKLVASLINDLQSLATKWNKYNYAEQKVEFAVGNRRFRLQYSHFNNDGRPLGKIDIVTHERDLLVEVVYFDQPLLNALAPALRELNKKVVPLKIPQDLKDLFQELLE